MRELGSEHLAAIAAARRRPHHHSHTGLNRRQFLGLAAAGGAVVATGPLARRARAGERPEVVRPRPINGGVGPFHVYPVTYKGVAPGAPGEPPAVWDQVTITDFRGTYASTDVFTLGADGTGRGLWSRSDMRVMEGIYVGVDGERHHGTFGFI